MKVMILENSIQIINRLIELIEETNKGLKFYNCVSNPNALELVKEVKPEVILMDLNMQGINSLELLKKIRKAGEKAIIICMFTMPDEKFLDDCKLNGADYLVDKYLDFEKIPDIISAARNNSLYHSSQ